MQILLTPVDTFFFRGHKSLGPGEDSAVTGIFPPRPGTVYGALRSAFINKHSVLYAFYQGEDPELQKWMGTPDQHGAFALKGVFLYDGREPVLPLPLDYQVVNETAEDGRVERAYPLQLYPGEPAYTSHGEKWHLYGVKEEKSESAEGAFLPLSQWKEELMEPQGVAVQRLDSWLVPEQKLGISRDWLRRSVIEGMIYQLEMQRFLPAQNGGVPGLLALCRAAPGFGDIPYLRLGGKNRPWHVHVLESSDPLFTTSEREKLADQIRASQLARVVFLTPAIWDGGAISSRYFDSQGHFCPGPDLAFKVRAAAIGRPVLIGGWDLAHRRPKPRQRAIPAGSVLYLEVPAEKVHQFIDAVLGRGAFEVDAWTGYKAMAIPMAVYESAAIGGPVDVQDVLDLKVEAYQSELNKLIGI